MTLKSEYSRDPLKILIEREERTCKGCVFERTERVFEIKIVTCVKLRRHGKRCVLFKERD